MKVAKIANEAPLSQIESEIKNIKYINLEILISHHLKNCDVFFKETLLIFTINRRKIIVEVHNHMYK